MRSAACGRRPLDIRHPMPCAWLGRAKLLPRTPRTSKNFPPYPPVCRPYAADPNPCRPLSSLVVPWCPSVPLGAHLYSTNPHFWIPSWPLAAPSWPLPAPSPSRSPSKCSRCTPNLQNDQHDFTILPKCSQLDSPGPHFHVKNQTKIIISRFVPWTFFR